MNFILKSLIKKQLQGVPDEQIDMIITAMEKNPAFFQTLAQEIKAKTDAGMSQQEAAASLMAKHGEELKKMMGK